MRGRSKLSVVLAVAGAALMAFVVGLPGCGGGCPFSSSNPDLSGMWRGGCGGDTVCQVVDDQGSITANCPGFGSCNGSACDGAASLDCTNTLDGTDYSGTVKISADGNTISGTLDGADGPCNVILQRMGGPGPH
jgi:hypothetical protein